MEKANEELAADVEVASKKFLAKVAEQEDEEGQQAERVRAFVAALRSGEFRQTKGVLHRPDDPTRTSGTVGHCCLGVACEVAMRGGLVLDRVVVQTSGDPRTWFGIVNPSGDDIGSKETLPGRVHRWFGFVETNPYLLVPREVMERAEATVAASWREDRRYSASSLNDDMELPFPLIADCFEYTFLREDWDAERVAN